MKRYVYSVTFRCNYICITYDSSWQSAVSKCEVSTPNEIRNQEEDLKTISEAINFNASKKIYESYGTSYYIISNLKIEEFNLLRITKNDTDFDAPNITVNFLN